MSKVVTPIDAKFLIDVAASRGLFGKNDDKKEEEKPQDKPQVTHVRKKSIFVKGSKAQQEKVSTLYCFDQSLTQRI